MAIHDLTLRGGPPVHPYVFSKRVMRADRRVKDGDVVRLLTREGKPCGYGFAHSRSQIAVRVLTYDADVVPDTDWLAGRVRAAEALRREVLRLPETTDAWRSVHAEGDGLSGLVVDRYGEVAVAGLFSLGWFRRAEELAEVLRRELGAKHVVLRSDEKTERQEGFAPPAPGRVPKVLVREGAVRYEVDPAGGHKTGFFVDQRENRARVAALARGREVFDGMCYTGGFALAAAKGGAAGVRGMDLDEEAVERAKKNSALNGFAPADGPVRFEHGDVFDALRAYAAGPEERRPDLLIVDPAKWARDRAGLGVALAKYRDLNRLALEAVRPGGLVVTCSCSGLVSEETFLSVLREAALDVRREVRMLTVAGAAADHPVAAAFPEGRYLKAVFLAVGPAGSGPGRSEGRALGLGPASDDRDDR